MRRILCVLGTVAVMNTTNIVIVARAEEQQPEAHEAAPLPKAKVGDEVSCAVDGMKMQLQADTPSAQYQGKVYYFCSDTEKQMFLKNPEHYTKH